MKLSKMPLIVFGLAVIVSQPIRAEALFSEDFTGYVTSELVGQIVDDKVPWHLPAKKDISPYVGGAGKGAPIDFRRCIRSKGGEGRAEKKGDFTISSTDRLILSFDVTPGGVTTFGFSPDFAISYSSSEKGGIYFIGRDQGRTINSFPIDKSGNRVTLAPGRWYRIICEIDFPTWTATLAYQEWDASASAWQEPVQLYLDQNETLKAIPFSAVDPGSLQNVYVRLSQSTGGAISNLKITKKTD